MAETIKLPVIGPVKRTYVMIAGAGIAGYVAYAWWNRSRPSGAAEVLPEDIPQDREPPATVVGTQEFDTGEVRAIINTNAEWFTSAIDYLVTTGGYDFVFTSATLGKFLARRQLTEQEATLVQAAKGAVGEPPQGGPWPIIRATGSAPPSGSGIYTRIELHRIGKVGQSYNARQIAARYAPSNSPDAVEAMLRRIYNANPALRGKTKIPGGYPLLVPYKTGEHAFAA